MEKYGYNVCTRQPFSVLPFSWVSDCSERPALIYCLLAGNRSRLFSWRLYSRGFAGAGIRNPELLRGETLHIPVSRCRIFPKLWRISQGTGQFVMGGSSGARLSRTHSFRNHGGIFTPNEAGGIAPFVRPLSLVRIQEAYLRSTEKLLFEHGRIRHDDASACRRNGSDAFLTRQGVRQELAPFMLSLLKQVSHSPHEDVFLSFWECSLDGITILDLFVALVLPLMTAARNQSVQLGSILVVNVGIGVVASVCDCRVSSARVLAVCPAGELRRQDAVLLSSDSRPSSDPYTSLSSCWLPQIFLGPEVVGSGIVRCTEKIREESMR